MLLTGDAPSKDIIKGLKELKQNDQEVKENLYYNNHYSWLYRYATLWIKAYYHPSSYIPFRNKLKSMCS